MTEFQIELPERIKVPEAKREEIVKALNAALEPFRKELKIWIEAKDATYNGWTNWETWAVCLWLGNERQTDREARRIARDPQLSDDEKIQGLKDTVYDYMHGNKERGIEEPIITDDISTHRVNWNEVLEAQKEE
jgi:hypothetical protein